MLKIKTFEFVLNFRSVMNFVDYYFGEEKEEEKLDYLRDFKFDLPIKISEWVKENFNENSLNRPKSLCVIGKTRSGKTAWARSLGKHVYWNQYYDLKKWDDEAQYIILDDIPFSKIYSVYKGLLGCQKSFTMTDKYLPKQTLKGKVCIWLVNSDQDPRRDEKWDQEVEEWMEGNVIFYNMYDRSMIPLVSDDDIFYEEYGCGYFELVFNQHRSTRQKKCPFQGTSMDYNLLIRPWNQCYLHNPIREMETRDQYEKRIRWQDPTEQYQMEKEVQLIKKDHVMNKKKKAVQTNTRSKRKESEQDIRRYLPSLKRRK
jgi:hypothetical protein